jgi:predicted PurR-regulated permease PerM
MLGGGVLAVGVGFVAGISASFIVIALTLYFLASLSAAKRALYDLAPAHSRVRLADLTERITGSVGSALIGSVILSSLNAAAVFILHVVIGLPFPALMAVIAFVITLIPLFGSVIFWIFASIIALFSSPTQALIFFIAYLIYIQLESYVISPRVMNKAIAIPAALVLIGALAGGALAGVVGVLVALPVMASILLIIREVVVPRQNLKI